jgi:ankyrin repeat protein
VTDDDKNLRLCQAVVANDVKGVRSALADGADIDARVRIADVSPQAALLYATNVPMVELLLDARADIEATDHRGHTVLERTVMGAGPSRIGVIEFLLRRGARISGFVLLRARHDAEVLTILEEWPIRSSTVSDADRQLMLAARAGALDAVKALLGAGANPIARDTTGASALDHAWKHRHADVAFALERAALSREASTALFLAVLDDAPVRVSRAAKRADLEARTERGATALVLAARYGRHKAVRALVKAGAALDARALVAAIQAGDWDGMHLLIELGARLDVTDASIVSAACEQPDVAFLRYLLIAEPRRLHICESEEHEGTRSVLIYHLAHTGAKRLASRQSDTAVHDAMMSELEELGCAVAETDFFCDYVWVAGADGVEVYDKECKALHAAGDRVTLRDGRVVARADIARVFTFAADDFVHRGVKATLCSGEEIRLVTEYSGLAMGDPCYSRNELLWETGWCSTLGHALATWAGAAFFDGI